MTHPLVADISQWTRETLKKSGQFATQIFTPPFDGLGLLCTLFLLWVYLVCPHSPILRGEFSDPDDYMYLDQVLDLMKGQSWYDNVQHRLNPPDGVPIHFSHVTMIPMIIVASFFRLLGFGYHGAAMLMAIIYPSFLFGGLLAAVRWMSSRYIPKTWAGISAYIALSCSILTFAFQPGHIHHHGTIVLVVAWALACTIRIFDEPERTLWPALAGAILGLGLTIALEILPWLLIISAWIGLWATATGGKAVRAGLLYALMLFVVSAAGLLATKPPAHLLTIDILMYSVVYVILTGSIAVAFSGLSLFANAKSVWRWLAGGFFAVVTGGAFLHHFPALITGPYGDVAPEIHAIILDNVIEAQPLKDMDTPWIEVGFFALSSFIALIISAYILRRCAKKDRWAWGLYFTLQLVVLLACLFYQRRFSGMCGMLSVMPLTVAFYHGWQWIGRHVQGRKRFWVEIALILSVGFGTNVLYPAVLDGRSFNKGVLLFPFSFSQETQRCQMYDLEKALNDPEQLGDKPHTILSGMSLGSEFLFRSNSSVLSAPYHLNVQGNVDATRFFSTPYPSEAEAIVRRRNVDLVIECAYIPSFYLFAPGKKGNPENDPSVIKDFAPHMAELLVEGRAPPWLHRVPLPNVSNYVVYSVVPEKETQKLKSEPKK